MSIFIPIYRFDLIVLSNFDKFLPAFYSMPPTSFHFILRLNDFEFLGPFSMHSISLFLSSILKYLYVSGVNTKSGIKLNYIGEDSNLPTPPII